MKKLYKLRLSKSERYAIKEFKKLIFEEHPNAEIILYGSKARGDANKHSDIDLFILLDKEIDRTIKEGITEIKFDIELKYDVILSTIIENREYWNSKVANSMPLHWNIDKEGVLI